MPPVRESVILCYPAISKIAKADINVYQYTEPIHTSQLKLQYDLLREVLDNHKISYKMLPTSTPDSMFAQDPFIITPTHIVIGRFKNQFRIEETKIIEKHLDNINAGKVRQVYKVDRGYLEGGDYLYHNNTTFIMAGQRTSRLAIRDMMYADVFGTAKIARITPDKSSSDPIKKHLDLILGFIDNVAVLWSGAKTYLVDVFDKTGKQIASLPLEYYLKSLGYRIFEVSDAEQQMYTCNFVCFDKIVLAQNPRLADATRKQVIVMPVSEPNKMGGGLHCLVKILY
jgi:N-dimethylarginine dimethylaminohydrolase